MVLVIVARIVYVINNILCLKKWGIRLSHVCSWMLEDVIESINEGDNLVSC